MRRPGSKSEPVLKMPALTSRVRYGKAGLDWLRKQCPSYTSVTVLADRNTARNCYPVIRSYLPAHRLVAVPAGERSKDLAACQRVWRALVTQRADRKALLINVGGGVVCDLGGFAASTFKRGIPFIHVPTSLMAQADAAIGGKNAINLDGQKNAVGVFRGAEAVIIHDRFLETLPARQLTSGFAEVIKHALISDAGTFDRLERLDSIPPGNVLSWIRFSIRIKSAIVSADPYEQERRRVLNFGHTAGHALEAVSLGRKMKVLTHGEAVAAGMVIESHAAYRQGMITHGQLTRITSFMATHFALPAVRKQNYAGMLRHMAQDKKNIRGKMRLSLLHGIGTCRTGCVISRQEMVQALDAYNRKLNQP